MKSTDLTFEQFCYNVEFLTIDQYNHIHGESINPDDFDAHQLPTVHDYVQGLHILYFCDLMTGPYAELTIGNQVWRTPVYSYTDLQRKLYEFYLQEKSKPAPRDFNNEIIRLEKLKEVIEYLPSRFEKDENGPLMDVYFTQCHELAREFMDHWNNKLMLSLDEFLAEPEVESSLESWAFLQGKKIMDLFSFNK